MNLAKLFQKTAYIVIGLAVVVLIGLTLYQRHLIKSIADNSGEKPSAAVESGKNSAGSAETSGQAGAGKAPPKAAADLAYQLDAAEEELDMAQDQLAEELQKKADLQKSMIELQKKAFQDPAQRKLIRSSMKGALDTTYGALFKGLNLSPEKLDALKELLTDRQMALADMSMEAIDAGMSQEKAAELKTRQESIESEYAGKIKAFLGEEGGTKYTAYQETIAERAVITPFLETLEGDQKLRDDQTETLIAAMQKARKEAEASLPFDESAIVSPTQLTEETISKIITHNDRVAEGYMNCAGAILSQSQVEKLQNYLAGQREIQVKCP